MDWMPLIVVNDREDQSIEMANEDDDDSLNHLVVHHHRNLACQPSIRSLISLMANRSRRTIIFSKSRLKKVNMPCLISNFIFNIESLNWQCLLFFTIQWIYCRIWWRTGWWQKRFSFSLCCNYFYLCVCLYHFMDPMRSFVQTVATKIMRSWVDVRLSSVSVYK